jgi:hypothetical protein
MRATASNWVDDDKSRGRDTLSKLLFPQIGSGTIFLNHIIYSSLIYHIYIKSINHSFPAIFIDLSDFSRKMRHRWPRALGGSSPFPLQKQQNLAAAEPVLRFLRGQEGKKASSSLLSIFNFFILLLLAASLPLAQVDAQSFTSRAACPGGFPMDGHVSKPEPFLH